MSTCVKVILKPLTSLKIIYWL